MQNVRQSRRAAWYAFFCIAVIIAVGFIAAYTAFRVSASLNELSSLAYQHRKVWDAISRDVSYVLSHSEEQSVPDTLAQRVQRQVAQLIEQDEALAQEISERIGQMELERRIGLFSEDEARKLEASVPPDVKRQVVNFVSAAPAFLQLGFTVWEATTHLKLRSGAAVKNLVDREVLIATMRSRLTEFMWKSLIAICLVVLLGILVVWGRILHPNIRKLEKSIIDQYRQMHEKEITQKKLAEREVELRIILDNTPAMIIGVDRECRYVSANKAYLTKFKLQDESELLGKYVEEVVGETNWRRLEPRIVDALSGRATSFELMMEYPGGPRFVQAHYVPLLTESGSVERFFALIIDLHERHLAEVALRAGEKNLETILDSLNEAVIAMDDAGRVRRMNSVAERMTGIDTARAKYEKLGDVVHFEDRSTHERIVDPVGRAREGRDRLTTDSEILLISADGDVRHVEWSLSETWNNDDGVAGRVIVLRDVTSEYALRAELIQNEKLQALGRLAGGIAHDFNNLLAGVSGAAEVLANVHKETLSRSAMEVVRDIIALTERAAGLTGQLMAFSQKGQISRQVLRIDELVGEIVKVLKNTVDRAVEIILVDDAESATVFGSVPAIHSAVLNLCINATQSMPNGGKLTISLSNVNLGAAECAKSTFELSAGKYIRMTFTDTGHGIDEGIIGQIFDPFFTTRNVGVGNGFGLTTTYATIVRHNGSITVESVLGEGTKFDILLPCCIEETQQGEFQPSVETRRSGEPVGTILLIDDEDLVRQSLCMMLEHLGATVLCASNGAEGVELYGQKSGEIDLVVIDMNMPVMNGPSAMAKMREIRSDCKFVAISGYSEFDLGSDEQPIELAASLTKPFSIKSLEALLKQVLPSKV